MGNSVVPIRIVRAKNTREWFIEQESHVLCSLIETSHIWTSHRVHLLRSPKGNWQIEPSGNGKNLTAFKVDDRSSKAEVRVAVDSVCELLFNKGSYKRMPSGQRWRIRSPQEDIYEYSTG